MKARFLSELVFQKLLIWRLSRESVSYVSSVNVAQMESTGLPNYVDIEADPRLNCADQP